MKKLNKLFDINADTDLRQKQFRSIFFTLKLLALFFFSIPFIEYLMSKTRGSDVIAGSMVVIFCVLGLISFLWFIMDKRRGDNSLFSLLEISVFFTICLASIWHSGGYESYYKFSFIFMIVLYTIEFGMKLGVTIAAIASATLLTIDLVWYRPEPGVTVNFFFENDLVLSAVFIIVAWILGYYVRRADEQMNILRDDANIDGLTKAYNHRYFYERVRKLCSNALKNHELLSLIMFDLDNFKVYNDMYGHQMGDELLIALTAYIKEKLGEDDILCRYGGDEFAVIMSGVTLSEATAFADKLRASVVEHNFAGEEHMPDGGVTISLGVAEFRSNAVNAEGKPTDNYRSFINRADSALYRAKFLKRNRVEVYSSIFEELGAGETHSTDKLQSLKTLITVINSRDSYTFNHVERVVLLTRDFSAYLKLSKDESRRLVYAAYLHDLGKININKETLISEGKLTDEEFSALRRHPVESAEIISGIEGFDDVIPIVRSHHERWDGTGYPDRLAHEAIPYLARMLTICDSFDAMTSLRPYQPTKTPAEGLIEIERCSGTQFDPKLAASFIKMQKQNEQV